MEVLKRGPHDPGGGLPGDPVVLLKGRLVVGGVDSAQAEHQLGERQAEAQEDDSVWGSSIKGRRLVISRTFSIFCSSASRMNCGEPSGAPRRMIPGSLTRSRPRSRGSSGMETRSVGHQTLVLGRAGAGTVAEVERMSRRGMSVAPCRTGHPALS